MSEVSVLLFNSPWTSPAIQPGLLARSAFVLEEVKRVADLLRRLESGHFAVVILCMKGGGIEFEELLSVIRSEKMPCSRCILILLTPTESLEQCRSYVGKGLNVLLPETVSTEELEAVIARQTQVAPRVQTRVMVRLRVSIQQSPSLLVCQTTNLSSSGMFLASATLPPIGTNITFEMNLPKSSASIAGEALVVRHASNGRENQRGMGVTFTSFRQDGQQVLRRFIDEALPNHSA